MRSEVKFAVHQCVQLIADTKIPHNQAIERILKYLKGVDTQGLIMKPDPEKGIKFYIYANLSGRWNKEEGKDHGLFLYRTGCVIAYANCTLIWVIQIQT